MRSSWMMRQERRMSLRRQQRRKGPLFWVVTAGGNHCRAAGFLRLWQKWCLAWNPEQRTCWTDGAGWIKMLATRKVCGVLASCVPCVGGGRWMTYGAVEAGSVKVYFRSVGRSVGWSVAGRPQTNCFRRRRGATGVGIGVRNRGLLFQVFVLTPHGRARSGRSRATCDSGGSGRKADGTK